MRKTQLAALASLAIVATAGTALAAPATERDRTNAARTCSSLRSTLGAATFTQTYGGGSARAAFGRCVAKMAAEARAARQAAATTCAAKAKGKGKNAAKAHARCVAAKTKAKLKQAHDATENAARACKAERSQLGAEAFAAKYGTNPNKRNAFGKCVSSKVSQKGGDQGESEAKRLTATLTGDAGSGTFTATVNLGTQQLCYTLTVTGLTDVTAAHIHVKPSGSIAVPLAAPTAGTSTACATVERALLKQILASPSTYYVNVHTTAAPAGALRGDLSR